MQAGRDVWRGSMAPMLPASTSGIPPPAARPEPFGNRFAGNPWWRRGLRRPGRVFSMRGPESRELHGGAFLPGLLLLWAMMRCKDEGGEAGDSPPNAGGSPPVAVLSASPRSGPAPLEVGFDASSSADPDGGGITCSWDFGNGQTSSSPTASVTYSVPGVYTATLTIVDPSGLSDQAEVVVLVEGSSAGESFAHAVVHLTNLERRAQGLPPLREEEMLASAALGHALDMASEDYFAHDSLDGRTPWDRIRDAGYDFNAAAENIAAGYSTPEEVVAGWMASSGHRANILLPDLRELGVGYFDEEGDTFPGPFGYRHYWVQDFGRRDDVFPVVIDDEAYRTADRSVELYLHGQGWAVRMKVSEDPSFTGASWQPFDPSLVWELSPDPGLKRVYVRLEGPGGAVRDAFDEIVLE